MHLHSSLFTVLESAFKIAKKDSMELRNIFTALVFVVMMHAESCDAINHLEKW